MKYQIIVVLVLLFSIGLPAQEQNTNTAVYWKQAGSHEINLNLEKAGVLPYADNIEMAGRRVAAIVDYSIDTAGILTLNRRVIFPQIHPFIKSTDPGWFVYRAYSNETYDDSVLPKLYIGNKQIQPGPVEKVTINGMLSFRHKANAEGLAFERVFYPSSSERLFVEAVTVTNKGNSVIEINASNSALIESGREADGGYQTQVASNAPSVRSLAPGETLTYAIRYTATKAGEVLPDQSAITARSERESFLKQMATSLRLETPDKRLNTLFEFSKIRASESIFESKLGLIHSPGGGRYYVGIWANDQAEYINPFFPFLGYETGNESAMNTYRAFAGELNDEFKKIRYAFEVEGTVPPFLLDRGDAAMIAYGASQFALALGDKETAEELWPLISWCLDYNKRQLNSEGVVNSESDEMEGRIETGTANLSTSALYYGALDHAADLAKSLGKSKRLVKAYRQQAVELSKAIENYFGANVEGLDTYKYYKEHRYLRHWICLPLVVGIHNRKDATIEALFERLWTENGVHVEKNSENEAVGKIFWDRGTLYALRGTFMAGATEQSLAKLQQFTQQRLLGNRVPYVVEAYPEGNMAHLSAESGLYCRVFIEGLLGMKPTGFKSFTCTPRLPQDWDQMSLNSIKAFGEDFDLNISRSGERLRVKVTGVNGKTIFSKNVKPGTSVEITFQ